MRVLRTVTTLALCLVPCLPVSADLAFIPGGTDLFGSRYVDGVVDEDSVAISTGLNDFKLFGRNLSSTIHVSENGLLTSVPNYDFYPDPIDSLSSSTQLIAPMWDDVFMLQPDLVPTQHANRVLEQKQAGSYYSVTWQNVRLHVETVVATDGELLLFPNTLRTVQVVLFGTEQTLRGFDFKANDIVFAYESFTTTTKDFVDFAREAALDPGKSFLNATVGLADTSNSATDHQGVEIGGVNMDANGDGYIQADEAAGNGSGATPRLPWDNLEFMLFRPELDSAGDFVQYDVSIQRFTTAVPEPSRTGLIWLAMLAVASLRRRS